MHWLKAFEQKHREGHFSFVFTGSISDGFPSMRHQKGDEPVDQLDPWYSAIMKHLDVKPNDLIWIFDPARGFQFPIPKHEEVVRTILRGDEHPVANDPIAQAQQALNKTKPLPNDPLDALLLMYRLFEHRTNPTSDVHRCVAILPDVDVLCTGTLQGTDRAMERIALMLIRIAEHDAFARSGHLLLMSTKTVSALPERLRRPESPIVPILISPPEEAERELFIVHLTDNLETTEQKIALTQQQLEQVKKLEADHLQEQIKHIDDAIMDIESKHERELRQNTKLIDAKRESNIFNMALQTLQTNPDQIASHKTAHEQLKKIEAQLKKARDTKSPKLSKTIWRLLKVGDQIVLTDGKDEECLTVLTPPDKHGDVQLSQIDSNSPMLTQSNTPSLFCWKSGIACRGTSTSEYIAYPIQSGTQILIRYAALAQLEAEAAELTARLKRSVKKEIAETQEQIKNADHRIQEIKAELEKDFAEEKATLEKKRAKLETERTYPMSDEMKRLLEEITRLDALLKTKQKAFPLPKIGLPSLTKLTANLGYRDIVSLLRAARGNGHELSADSVVKKRIELLKKSYGDLLEIEIPPYGFDGVAGLEYVKTYFRRVRDAMLSGDLRRVPMGCLLMGPPGTGKSALATALAHEAGILLVKVRPVRSKWVGESEQRMEQLLQALRNLAPVVVFRDEIDQEDQGRDGYSGDSGVSNRLRQAWMTFLSDPTIRGRVFVVSASNRPDLLDPALKRAGRTDDRIPLLMPNTQTRIHLFEVMIKRYEFASLLTAFELFAEKTDGLSGADVEVIVRQADQYGNGVIDETALTRAIEDYIPSASAVENARMTIEAIRNCSSKAFLPDNVTAEIEKASRVLQGLPAQGEIQEIDLARVNRRVEEA